VTRVATLPPTDVASDANDAPTEVASVKMDPADPPSSVTRRNASYNWDSPPEVTSLAIDSTTDTTWGKTSQTWALVDTTHAVRTLPPLRGLEFWSGESKRGKKDYGENANKLHDGSSGSDSSVERERKGLDSMAGHQAG
jgi:hypothetical protein